MKTVTINEENARKAYNEAPDEFKKTLATLLGPDVVLPDPMDRYKTWLDICLASDLDPVRCLPYPIPTTKQQVSLNGFAKLQLIYEAFNQGWEPDYSNSNQWKHYPWFEFVPADGGFVYTYSSFTLASTDLGARLCTDTEAKAVYIGKQFCDIFNEAFNPQID